MVKLKVDVTEANYEDAVDYVGGFSESPQPGLHPFVVKEIVPGHAKGDDGKPDKSRPRVEVVLQCESAKFKGAYVWKYFLQKGHDKYVKRNADEWYQFLLAVGALTKTKKTADIDTDKLVGKHIVVQVRAGKSQDGTYRGEYAAAFPAGHQGVEADADADEGLLDEGDELADDETGEDEWEARRAELSSAQVADLKPIAKEYGITLAGHKKYSLIEAIIEHEQSLEGDELADEDELLDDDEELLDDGENSGPYLTREQLEAMETAELIAAAKDFDLVTKGKKKSQVIDEILTAQAAPGDVGDDDELPF